MSSRVLFRMSFLRFSRLSSRFSIFMVPNTRSLMVSTSSSLIFSLILKGMVVHVKFRAITSLWMFFTANVASSGMSSFMFTYSVTISRMSLMAAENSRSRFSGCISSDGLTLPFR